MRGNVKSVQTKPVPFQISPYLKPVKRGVLPVCFSLVVSVCVQQAALTSSLAWTQTLQLMADVLLLSLLLSISSPLFSPSISALLPIFSSPSLSFYLCLPRWFSPCILTSSIPPLCACPLSLPYPSFPPFLSLSQLALQNEPICRLYGWGLMKFRQQLSTLASLWASLIHLFSCVYKKHSQASKICDPVCVSVRTLRMCSRPVFQHTVPYRGTFLQWCLFGESSL